MRVKRPFSSSTMSALGTSSSAPAQIWVMIRRFASDGNEGLNSARASDRFSASARTNADRSLRTLSRRFASWAAS